MNLKNLLLPVITPWLIKGISYSRLPILNGELRLSGLSADVEVFFDDWAVPHIYALTIQDLLMTQGYLHAQERLFQMDVQRRLGAGRLSEIFGKDALLADRWMRVLSFTEVAARELSLMDSDEKLFLESYCRGINAFIQRNRLPAEFLLLGYKPEPWKTQDILLWVKMMALNLSSNWDSELTRKWLFEHLGDEAKNLQVDFTEDWPIILSLPTLLGEDGFTLRQARKFTGPSAADGIGSNNWVVSGKRTKSGLPLLANDMHLGLTVPSIWYENHLETPDLRVAGLSFPGLPFVIAGHNEHVAWGYTAGLADTQDLFEEHLREEDEQVFYEYQGEWLKADVRVEKIKIKGGTSFEEKVISTHHGPMINCLVDTDRSLPPLALRWDVYDADKFPVRALIHMNRAQNCIEFRDALKFWVHPNQNVVYADTSGNIGYTLAGRVPIRVKGDGGMPVPGWMGEYEWTGYIPYEEMPHLYNPEQGYTATANNRTAPPDYPYWLSRDYIRGDRCERICELILENTQMDVDIVKKMQVDRISTMARDLIASLKTVHTDNPKLEKILPLMQSWNCDLTTDCIEASIYHMTILELLSLLLQNKLEDLYPYYLGKKVISLPTVNVWGDHAFEWLHKQLKMPGASWFGLNEEKTKGDVVLSALEKAVDALTDQLGPDMNLWGWGKIHQLTLTHYLSASELLAPAFNLGPFPVGGDVTTIWAEFSSPLDKQNKVTGGPPFRFIADLSDLDHCLGVLLPGQSGNPSSPHYSDQIQDWLSGNYHPMYFARKDVESGCRHKLVIMPK